MIIGAAFAKIVDSMVKDLIMPLGNWILRGQVDFSNKYLVLSGSVPDGTALAEAQKLGNVLAYGNFLTIMINFVLLAMVVFAMIHQVNRMKRVLPDGARVGRSTSSRDRRRSS